MAKEVIQIQLAWFFEGEYDGSFEKISFKIKERLDNSEQTQYIPIPNSAPGELPRLFLKYKDFNINFSKNRADLYFKNYDQINKENIKKITTFIIDELKIRIIRIGFVKSFFTEETLDYIKNLFKEDKIAGLDIKEIGFNLNVPKEIGNIKCNNIENLAMGSAIKNGEVKNGLIISRDINTIIEERKKLEQIDRVLATVDALNDEADNYIV